MKKALLSLLIFIDIYLLLILTGPCVLASDVSLSCAELLFSGDVEGCRDYLGKGWTVERADADCSNLPGSKGGTLNENGYCRDSRSSLGNCIVDGGTPEETRLYFYNGDPATLKYACTRFMTGEWAAPDITSCNHLDVTPSPGGPSVSACTEYSGLAWNSEDAAWDCGLKEQGRLNSGEGCANDGALGYCTLDGEGTYGAKVYYYAGDTDALKESCEEKNDGIWTSLQLPADNGEMMKAGDVALESSPKVSVTPNGRQTRILDELIANKRAIEFTPTARISDNGLIIYPAEDVDPRAYAVGAKMIAEKGFFVAIVPFSNRLPTSDPMRADDVILAHPEITAWAIAGHASGGTAASIYADANPLGKVKAIAFWGAYPPKTVNLKQSGLKGITVLGTLDGIVDRREWNAASVRLPQATYVVDLYGGNHSQFGYYADPAGDNPAKISREYQHELYTGATIHLLNRINVAPLRDVINPLFTFQMPQTETLGKNAQVTIAGLRYLDLNRREVKNEIIMDQEDFQSSKPSFPTRGTSLVDIVTHPHQTANPFDISLPPVYDGDLWIKMKSQSAFVEEYGVTPTDEKPCGCEEINKSIFNYVTNKLDFFTYLKFRLANVALTYEEDFKAVSGPGWLNQPVVLQSDGRARYTLRAARLEVDASMPEPIGGSFYCKVWSPGAALKFILDTAN